MCYHKNVNVVDMRNYIKQQQSKRKEWLLYNTIPVHIINPFPPQLNIQNIVDNVETNLLKNLYSKWEYLSQKVTFKFSYAEGTKFRYTVKLWTNRDYSIKGNIANDVCAHCRTKKLI